MYYVVTIALLITMALALVRALLGPDHRSWSVRTSLSWGGESIGRLSAAER